MSTKRILALVLSLVLFTTMFAVTVAAAVPEEDFVDPCAHACSCGGLYTKYKTRYSSWYVDGMQECIHGGTDRDIIQRRIKYTDLVCSACGDVYSTTSVTETRLVCPN